MSRDLEEFVHHLKDVWKLRRFHLLGHSFGGAVGYEYLKRQSIASREASGEGGVPQCLSFILSNASTNFQLSSSEQMRLFQEFSQTKIPSKQQKTKSLDVREQFFQTHICRTPRKPAELESALSRRGKQWSANEYTAMPLAHDTTLGAADADAAVGGGANQFPPVLIVRGQYDFVTDRCTRGWNDIFASSMVRGQTKPKEVVMKDCSHYPHFERPEQYCREVEQFCSIAESQLP